MGYPVTKRKSEPCSRTAQPALVGGGEVGLAARVPACLSGDEPLRIGKVQFGNLRWHVGNLQLQPLGSIASTCGNGRSHGGDHVAEHRHHVMVICDEAEFSVQACVLSQVPRRVVRLCAEDRASLIDPLEDPDHGLLIELRRLREVGGLAEIVDREDVRAGLSG
jgi:hypothetical protein